MQAKDTSGWTRTEELRLSYANPSLSCLNIFYNFQHENIEKFLIQKECDSNSLMFFFRNLTDVKTRALQEEVNEGIKSVRVEGGSGILTLKITLPITPEHKKFVENATAKANNHYPPIDKELLEELSKELEIPLEEKHRQEIKNLEAKKNPFSFQTTPSPNATWVETASRKDSFCQGK